MHLKHLQGFYTDDKINSNLLNGKVGRLEKLVKTLARVTVWGQLRSAGHQGADTAYDFIGFASNTKWQKLLMEHINEFRINRFRGLRDLKIEGLGQVNLFVGNNNSGKTSVLEVLSLFGDPLNGRRWYDTGSQRELFTDPSSVLDRVIWLFAQGADPKEKGSLSLSASGNIPIKDVSASYEKFNEIVSRPRQKH